MLYFYLIINCISCFSFHDLQHVDELRNIFNRLKFKKKIENIFEIL